MKKTLILLGILFASIPFFSQSQDLEQTTETASEKKLDPSRMVFGGNIGASFGNFTFIQFSPQVGYQFTPHFTAGAGIKFIYSSQITPIFDNGDKYKFGYAGLNIFARYFPTNFLFASLQPELNYNWGKLDYRNSADTDLKVAGKMVPSLLVGAGGLLGRNGRGTTVSIQYDLIQSDRSPYGQNAFVNFGFVF